VVKCKNLRLFRLLRTAAHCRVADVRMQVHDGKVWYCKERLCPDLILEVTNRLLPSQFDVLMARDWILRETDLYAEIYGMEVITKAAERNALWLPELPGCVAGDFLREIADGDHIAALEAFCACLRSLHSLHYHSFNNPIGTCCPFSHGDASIWNVLYDRNTNAATWFDFETAHKSHLSDLARQADDVAVFLYSSAAVIPPQFWDDLILTALMLYSEHSLLQALIAQTCRDMRPSFFRLKQVRMRRPQYRAFTAALRERLEAALQVEALDSKAQS